MNDPMIKIASATKTFIRVLVAGLMFLWLMPRIHAQYPIEQWFTLPDFDMTANVVLYTPNGLMMLTNTYGFGIDTSTGFTYHGDYPIHAGVYRLSPEGDSLDVVWYNAGRFSEYIGSSLLDASPARHLFQTPDGKYWMFQDANAIIECFEGRYINLQKPTFTTMEEDLTTIYDTVLVEPDCSPLNIYAAFQSDPDSVMLILGVLDTIEIHLIHTTNYGERIILAGEHQFPFEYTKEYGLDKKNKRLIQWGPSLGDQKDSIRYTSFDYQEYKVEEVILKANKLPAPINGESIRKIYNSNHGGMFFACEVLIVIDGRANKSGFRLIRLGEDHDILWEHIYEHLWIQDITELPNGMALLLSRPATFGDNQANIIVSLIDVDGQLLWEKSYAEGALEYFPNSIATDGITFSFVADWFLREYYWGKKAKGYFVQDLLPAFVRNDRESCTFELFPNPSSNELNLYHPTEANVKATLCDLSGRVCLVQSIHGHHGELSVSNLASGMYIVKLLSSEGEPLGSCKFVKQ